MKLNLLAWIEENRHLLKPPVGNQELFLNNGEFIIMVVGGPNKRNDFHINEGAELFYQLKGEVNIQTYENGKIKDNFLSANEIMLLPALVPHRPKRPANTVGLVIEHPRKEEEIDGFLWVCENCHNTLHKEEENVTDIVNQLPVIMNRFNGNAELHTCKNCGTVNYQ